jgi:hypothetical protein
LKINRSRVKKISFLFALIALRFRYLNRREYDQAQQLMILRHSVDAIDLSVNEAVCKLCGTSPADNIRAIESLFQNIQHEQLQ